MKRIAFALASFAAACLGLLPGAAVAKVAQVSAGGFVVRHIAQVSTGVDETWALLLKPAVWWDSDHTWSGDAANLSIDARAGGCFCEILPNATSPKAAPRGSVEHMRVVYVERPRALRMVGALGPLQADAATATLTIQLKAEGKGTQVLLEYVVGGFTRTPFDTLAPSVDAMLGAQMGRFAEKLGGSFAAAFPIEPALAEPALAVPEAVEAQAPDDGVVPLSSTPPSSNGTVVGR